MQKGKNLDIEFTELNRDMFYKLNSSDESGNCSICKCDDNGECTYCQDCACGQYCDCGDCNCSDCVSNCGDCVT